MPLDRYAIKFFAEKNGMIDDSELIPIFHDWIRRHVLPELLIDVADYEHVAGGPGVMLVSHEALYAFDHDNGQDGLLYQRRRPVSDETEDLGFLRGFRGVVRACAALEKEDALERRLRFHGDRFLFIINDRLAAKNTPEDFARIMPAAQRIGETILAGGVSVSRASEDPRDRLSFLLRSDTSQTISDLHKKLGI